MLTVWQSGNRKTENFKFFRATPWCTVPKRVSHVNWADKTPKKAFRLVNNQTPLEKEKQLQELVIIMKNSTFLTVYDDPYDMRPLGGHSQKSCGHMSKAYEDDP